MSILHTLGGYPEVRVPLKAGVRYAYLGRLENSLLLERRPDVGLDSAYMPTRRLALPREIVGPSLCTEVLEAGG